MNALVPVSAIPAQAGSNHRRPPGALTVAAPLRVDVRSARETYRRNSCLTHRYLESDRPAPGAVFFSYQA
jgi:hypothetical protein